jgi:hypothetical protein
MWHWKGVRTNPLGLFDEQFVDTTKVPKKNRNWWCKGDDKIRSRWPMFSLCPEPVVGINLPENFNL